MGGLSSSTQARIYISLDGDWMLDHVDAIMATISHPDFHQQDRRPGRERFYRQHLDLKRWLRVVVDFNEQPAWVVTATVQRHDPRRWQ